MYRQTGIELIAEERERQMIQKGYLAQSDDNHSEYELSKAALCYVIGAATDDVIRSLMDKEGIAGTPPVFLKSWPWELESFKPRSRVEDLVRAGALIAAEIDRLQRIGRSDDGVF